jgi:hypothetical protein
MSFPEINAEARGHDFYPAGDEQFPALYSTEETKPADKVVVAHFFGGGCDWWMVEYDPSEHLAFGFCSLGNIQNAEWGYFNLMELEFATYPISGDGVRTRRVVMPFEREQDWVPKPASEAIPQQFQMEWWSK